MLLLRSFCCGTFCSHVINGQKLLNIISMGRRSHCNEKSLSWKMLSCSENTHILCKGNQLSLFAQPHVWFHFDQISKSVIKFNVSKGDLQSFFTTRAVHCIIYKLLQWPLVDFRSAVLIQSLAFLFTVKCIGKKKRSGMALFLPNCCRNSHREQQGQLFLEMYASSWSNCHCSITFMGQLASQST